MRLRIAASRAERKPRLILTLTESDLVSGEELARWLGLSGKEIYDLAKAGILGSAAPTDLSKASAVTVNICAGRRRLTTPQVEQPISPAELTGSRSNGATRSIYRRLLRPRIPNSASRSIGPKARSLETQSRPALAQSE